MSKQRQLKIQDKITNRNANIGRYFADLSNYRQITQAEEVELALRVQKGDMEARDKLVSANLRFVISVAKQYAGNSVDLFSDLIQHGSAGLIHAAETFDPTKGFKFISHAVWSIRKEMFEYLSKYSRTVRQPTNFINDSSRIRKAESILFTKLGREPDDAEVFETIKSQGYKIVDTRVDFVKTHTVSTIPLDSPPFEDAGSPIDWLASGERSDSLLDDYDKTLTVSLLLNKLSEADADIVRKVHGIGGPPHSFIQIAHDFDRSYEWARLKYTKALRKLKHSAKLIAKD